MGGGDIHAEVQSDEDRLEVYCVFAVWGVSVLCWVVVGVEYTGNVIVCVCVRWMYKLCVVLYYMEENIGKTERKLVLR